MHFRKRIGEGGVEPQETDEGTRRQASQGFIVPLETGPRKCLEQLNPAARTFCTTSRLTTSYENSMCFRKAVTVRALKNHPVPRIHLENSREHENMKWLSAKIPLGRMANSGQYRRFVVT